MIIITQEFTESVRTKHFYNIHRTSKGNKNVYKFV